MYIIVINMLWLELVFCSVFCSTLFLVSKYLKDLYMFLTWKPPFHEPPLRATHLPTLLSSTVVFYDWKAMFVRHTHPISLYNPLLFEIIEKAMFVCSVALKMARNP